MRKVLFDKINGELRTVTDYFASLQGFPMLRLVTGIKVGSRVKPGDNLLVLQLAGRPDMVIEAPPGCRGTINGLGKWSEDMAVSPSKVLLYVHPDEP